VEIFAPQSFPINSKLIELKPISEPTQNTLVFELIYLFLKPISRLFLLKPEGIF